MTTKIKYKIFLLYILTILSPIIFFILLSWVHREHSLLYPGVVSTFIWIMALLKLRFFNQHLLHVKEQSNKLNKTIMINKELEKYNEIKEIMLQISYSIVNIKNMDDLLKLFVDSTTEIIDKADTSSILIRNDRGLFEFKAIHDRNSSPLSKITLSMDETFLNHPDSFNGKSRIIHNPMEFNSIHLSKSNDRLFRKLNLSNIQSTICTPIIVDHQIYGMINVDSYHLQDCFKEEDQVIMEYLSNQLSIAIKNVLLFEKTLFLSRYDGLTKVYHRHFFEEMFQNVYERAKRYDEAFCLCIMDLNHLKEVNDCHGHLAGDLVIKHFSQTLKNSIRDSDILGRYGGDEFVLILLNSNYENAHKRVEKISKRMKKHTLFYNDVHFNVEFSFGISSFPKDAMDMKELYKIADTRMYKNKEYKK